MANDVEVWEASSRLGERCGIFGCEERPASPCATCEIWYCYDHLIIHFDVPPETEQDYKNNRIKFKIFLLL